MSTTSKVNDDATTKMIKGIASFWRSNVTNCIRYSPKTDFWSFFGINLLSGGAAGAFSLTFVHPLDYARTRLASDVGSGKKPFSGLGDCLVKTPKGPKGILGLYQGFGISVAGIIPYRGVQFGFNDTLKGLNPWDKEVSFSGIASKSLGAQLSVILSGFVTYPFDTIRRRLQMEAVKPSNEILYRGALIVSLELSKTKELPLYSKELVPTSLEVLVQL
ncbi:hypothetical protein HDU92_004362 [Lobulomyces angularis]|nr:hypothetical protein HDU92_004362 [Lobulomyces angularis]